MFNRYDADLLTLGYKLGRVIQLPNEVDPDYMELGKAMASFANVEQEEELLHRMMKHLLIEDSVDSNVRMINFLLGYKGVKEFISAPIRMEDSGAVCYLKVYRIVDPAKVEKEAFMTSDFAAYCKTFVVLESLESTYPGSGSLLLNKIKDEIQAPILLAAGFLHYGDYEVEVRDQVDSGILDNLVAFYVNNGFHIVNNRIGNYECAVAMLHVPKKQEDLLKRILKTKE